VVVGPVLQRHREQTDERIVGHGVRERAEGHGSVRPLHPRGQLEAIQWHRVREHGTIALG
jgi:hypothetical protein